MTRTSLPAFVAFCCFSVVYAAYAFDGSDKEALADEHLKINSAIDHVVQQYAQRHAFEGAILVAQSDNILYENAFGIANRATNKAFENNSVIQLASLSKPITATLILLLEQQGVLSVDNTVASYLPAFDNDTGRKITIHHLLSHRSGLPNHFVIDGWFNPEFHSATSESDFTDLIAQLPLSFEPGQDYQYSNPGYFLLGMIIEKALNTSYSDVYRERLFEKLNMQNTGLAFENERIKTAKGYQWSVDGGYKEQVAKDMKLFGAGAAIQSNLSDLLAFQSALYAGGLLTQESKNKLFNSKTPYSWRIQEIEIAPNKVRTVHNYDGKFDGFSTMMTRLVEDQYSIIILSNNGISYALKAQLTSDIATVLYGEKAPERNNDMVLHIIQSIVDGSFEKTLAGIKANEIMLQHDEQGLSSLAFEILWSGLAEQALTLFSYINDVYPNSTGAKDNLQFACNHRLTAGAKNRADLCS